MKAIALALVLVASAHGGELAKRALDLDLREGLSEQLEDDLARFADALRAKRFPEAAAWFDAPYAGPLVVGGRVKKDWPDAWTRRLRWEPDKGIPVEHGLAAISPLVALLDKWRAIDDVRVHVMNARFSTRDGKEGSATLRVEAHGVDANDMRVLFATEWAAAVEFRRDRYRFRALRVPWAEVRTGHATLFEEAGLSVRRNPGSQEKGSGPGGIDWTWRGAAAGDLDGDGVCDLVIPSPTGAEVLLARDGGWVERELLAGNATGCLTADLDGDGDQDVVLGLAAAPGIALFENTGDGFRRRAGLDAGPFVYGLCAADFDGDGRLDLYAARYEAFGQVTPSSWTDARDAAPNRLFVQVGPFAFRECAGERGVADTRWSYACAAADADLDGDVDLFVANDYGIDGYFENDGRGRFRDRAAAVGIADPGQGMGADWGDFDGDGQLDLSVANSSSPPAQRVLDALFDDPRDPAAAPVRALANGNGFYVRRGSEWKDVRAAGMRDAGWAWGGGYLDFDNDGWLDLFWTNGFLSGTGGREREAVYWRHVAMSTLAVPKLVAEKPASPGYLSRQYGPVLTGNARFAGRQRDRLFWNERGGGAADVSAVSGADLAGDGRGVAFLDFEHDGDTDVLVHELSGPRLLRNAIGARAAWVRLELVGTRGERDAIGARVTVRAAGREMLRHVACGGGFASAHDRALLVGLGKAGAAELVTVRWPAGLTERFGPFAAGTSHRLVEGAGRRE